LQLKRVDGSTVKIRSFNIKNLYLLEFPSRNQCAAALLPIQSGLLVNMKKFFPQALVAFVLASQTLTQAQAQFGSPIPGADTATNPGFTANDQINNQTNLSPNTANLANPPLNPPQASINAPSYVSAPVPGQSLNQIYQGQVTTSTNAIPNQQANKSRYQQLPISANDAQVRLQELASQITYNVVPANLLKDIQQNVMELGDWLSDLTDAHYRMYTSFAKFPSTRRAAEAEKITFQNFRLLKHQAQLLKAQILIKQNRVPEALGPLVDVVVAEPQTTTGQSAYKLLKEIGFSQEATNVVPQSKLEPPTAQIPLEAPVQDPLAKASESPANLNSLSPNQVVMPPKAPSKVVATKVRRLAPAQTPIQNQGQFQFRKGR
jgi:hypothetical protein